MHSVTGTSSYFLTTFKVGDVVVPDPFFVEHFPPGTAIVTKVSVHGGHTTIDLLFGDGTIFPGNIDNYFSLAPEVTSETPRPHMCLLFKTYVGFTDIFDYCTQCNKRRENYVRS